MIDLRALRHFAVLARHLHYLRAADELGITQPTLTRSIQALELRLGVLLFDRDRGGVDLTPQGRLIAEQAALLLLDAEELERKARLAAVSEAGHVRFGMTPMPARALLDRLLIDRLRSAPMATHAVVVRHVEALWGMLIAGEIEFFVSSERPPHDLSPARVELLGRFPLTVVVRPGHPLLADYPAVTSDKRYPLLRSAWAGVPLPDEIASIVHTPPNIIEDYATLARIAAETDAVWLASAYALAPELAKGSLVELTRVDRHVDVALYTLARRSRSPLAIALSERLAKQVGELAAAGDDVNAGPGRSIAARSIRSDK